MCIRDSNHIIKNGLQNGMQNYRCKDCGRQFRVTTGTFVYRLQKKEKMLDYIRCMVAGKSLRACAKEVGISLPLSLIHILSGTPDSENLTQSTAGGD